MTGRPLTPGELAKLMGVDVKTVARWTDEGRISSYRTPGNQRRFTAEVVVDALVAGGCGRDDAEAMVAKVLRRQAGGS